MKKFFVDFEYIAGHKHRIGIGFETFDIAHKFAESTMKTMNELNNHQIINYTITYKEELK